MKIREFCVILMLLIVTVGPGLRSENSLTLPADYATFYIPSEQTTYIEFYYSLYRHQLGFIGSDSNDHLYAGVLVTATVFDEAGTAIDSASTYFLSQVKDEIERDQTDIRLFDYLPVKIQPGHYRVELSAIDDVSKAVGKTILLVSVPDYSEPKLISSDLELAYEIRDLSDDSSGAVNPRLVKEDRLVVPNPTGVYQPDLDHTVYVYSELYGLKPGDTTDNGFTVHYMIKDPHGNVIRDFGRQELIKPGESAVVANALDITGLDPGQYHMIMESEDAASGQTTIASRRISLLGPEAMITTASDEDLQLMINIAWYHLSEAEKMQVGDLSPIGKGNMIRQFWRNQDDDPSTPENPVYDEAVRRFVYANENFSTSVDRQNGWRTDRGRVFITYGPYDDIQDEIMTGKSYPYSKWIYYQLEGGCIFVFVNDYVAGAIDYRLVHSTHPREKYDPKWKTILEEEDTQDDDWKDAGDKEF